MKKISKVNYMTQSGNDVVVRVTILHGPEDKGIWIDREERITDELSRKGKNTATECSKVATGTIPMRPNTYLILLMMKKKYPKELGDLWAFHC